MPLTPETWLATVIANQTTTGSQVRPGITQLANGNILVSWESDDPSGVGSPADTDIIGQIFDPLGVPVGTEIRLNGLVTRDERFLDTAGIPGGGFITVYQRDTGGTFNDIELTQRDNSGALIRNSTIYVDPVSSATPDGVDPQVAVASATSAIVVWRELEAGGTDSRIVGASYDPSTGAVGPLVSLLNAAGSNSSPDVVALTNGNFVIVGVLGGADSAITLRIVDSTLGNVLVATAIPSTAGNSESDYEPSVTALTGGGFVVAWTNIDANDADIIFQIFDAAGSLVGSDVPVTANGTTDNGNEPEVLGLSDGGFLVIFDEDTEGSLQARHYSATGTALGAEYTIEVGGAVTGPDAVLLADGRVAVTFQTDLGEIGMHILDMRDAPNNPVYSPDNWQIGTIGDDTFTGNAAIVHGHDGNDTIIDGVGLNNIFGDAGNDRIVLSGVDATETVNGGSGIDTIATDSFATGVDLSLGEVRSGITIQRALNFENVDHSGASSNITIIGNGADNILFGGSANDSINAGAGSDVLSGGLGNDRLAGGSGIDTMTGGAGNDIYFVNDVGDRTIETSAFDGRDVVYSTLTHVMEDNIDDLYLLGSGGFDGTGNALDNRIVGNSGNNSLYGGAGSDRMIAGLGNDALFGGTGGDLMFGRQGNDIYSIDNAGDRAVESPGQGFDTVFASVSTILGTAVERLYLQGAANLNGFGGIDGNLIYGNSGDNSLNGQIGNDILYGGAGNDRIVGGAGADTLYGDAGNDTFYFDNVGDTAVESAGQGYDIVLSTVSTALGANIEELRLLGGAALTGTGTGGNDRLVGNIAANTLLGGAGNDVLIGGDGSDRLVGGTGDDQYFGGAGADTFVLQSNWGTDRVTGFVAAGAADRIDLSGVGQISSFADLSANHLSEVGGNAVISLGANTLTLLGVSAATLAIDDFLF